VASSRALGHPAQADRPVADARLKPDEGECKMPRFTQKRDEEWRKFCGGLLAPGQSFRPFWLRSPVSDAAAPQSVHGLFRVLVAAVALLMLWSGMALATEMALGRFEDAAKSAIVASSRALGHPAQADRPVADARLW
jgi:hypothetical protein